MQRQSDVQISNSIWVIDYWDNAHAPKAWHFQSHLHFISQVVMIFLPLLAVSDLVAGGFGHGLLLGSMDWLFVSLECSLDTWNRCASFASSLLYKCHQLPAIFSHMHVEHLFRNPWRSRSYRWPSYSLSLPLVVRLSPSMFTDFQKGIYVVWGSP